MFKGSNHVIESKRGEIPRLRLLVESNFPVAYYMCTFFEEMETEDWLGVVIMAYNALYGPYFTFFWAYYTLEFSERTEAIILLTHKTH